MVNLSGLMTLVFSWPFRLRVVPLSLSPSSMTHHSARKKCLEASINKPRGKNSPLQQRERTGKEYGCLPFV